MKKYLFATILAIGFLFPSLSQAATIVSYTPATSTLAATGQGGNGTAATYNGQIFSLFTTATISSVTFTTGSAQANASPNSMTYKLFNSSGVEKATVTTTNRVVGIGAEWTETFTTPVLLTPGTYFIGSHYTSGSGVTMGYLATGTYSNSNRGCLYTGYVAAATFSLASCSSASDIYFKLNGITGYATGFTVLTDGSHYSDFDFWYVNVSGTVTVGDSICVLYRPVAMDTNQYSDCRVVRVGENPSTSYKIPKSQPLNDGERVSVLDAFSSIGSLSAAEQTWIASVYQYSSVDQSTLSSSSEITINIGNSYGSPDPIALATSTTKYASSTGSLSDYQWENIDCSALSSFSADALTCGLKKTFGWIAHVLFIPTKESEGFLKDSYTDFKGVFPFNIFFSITGKVSSEITGYATAATSTIQFIKFPNRTVDQITLIPSTGLWTYLFGSSFTNTIYNYLLLFAGLLAIRILYTLLFQSKL